jgi:hypothetical protein
MVVVMTAGMKAGVATTVRHLIGIAGMMALVLQIQTVLVVSVVSMNAIQNPAKVASVATVTVPTDRTAHAMVVLIKGRDLPIAAAVNGIVIHALLVIGITEHANPM